MTEATISKWGNSLALRLPKAITDEANLAEGSVVEITLDNGTLRVAAKPKKYTLAELLASHPPLEPDPHTGLREIDWGPDVGREKW